MILICSISYCQDTSSYDKQVNIALLRGLECCENVKAADSVNLLQQDQISNLMVQRTNMQHKYDLKFTDWRQADSLYKHTAMQLSKSNFEVQRLKKGKRNWQLFGISVGLGAGVLTYFMVK